MDPIEAIVNKNHDNKRTVVRNRRLKKHIKRINIAAVVAVACLLFTLIGLVHPGLAIPIMMVALMWGCYHFGRCVRFGMRVR